MPALLRTPDTAFKNTAVPVASTAGVLIATASQQAYRQTVLIQNLGPNAIYIGQSGVTTATGIQIAASGGTLAVDLGPGVTLYAIAATLTQVSPLDTRVVEIA